MNESIFKSYDIRGIYPSELTEESAYAIGRAFASLSKAKKVVVGFDARLSSEVLFNALSKGLISAGVDVVNIGQVPTECLYFAVAHYDFEAGIMITASHNPKEYNGFKMLKRNGRDIEIIRGRDLLASMKGGDSQGEKNGAITKKEIWKDYIPYILKFSGKIKPLKIALDASNGVIGGVIEKVTDKLPLEITKLNFKPDGNFPNHSPNPLEQGSVNQIAEAIGEHKLDFGFMFDGDADRVFLVDENGALVPSDVTLLLLAKYFLEKNPGSGIAYNLICSKAVREFIEKWGGVPVRTPVGFVNVREGLLKNNGVLGGELSGHYCFKDYFFMDSGMMAFLILLEVLSKETKSLSEAIKELSPYFKTELNFKINNKDEVLEKIKEKYSDGKQDALDGITVEYGSWWFNARPSNTEPLLRLTIEADTQELLEEKKKELSDLINS